MSNALANEVLPQVVSQFEELRTKMLSEVRDPILRQMTEFEDELASLQQSDDRATENHTVRNKYAQAPINCYRQRRRPCSLNCSCRCHMIAVNSFGNNSWKLSFFGLVVRVSGGSIDGECTYRACANIHLPRAKEVMLFYNCPSWLFRGGISAFFSSNMHGTPELNIRIFNRLETGTPESMTNIFGCIERGDVQAVKDLLQEGRASIYDIRGNTNETPLFAALYRIDIPIIRLLLQAGADPFSEVHMNPGLLWEVIQIHVSARRGGQELVDMIPVFDHVELSPLHRAVSGLLHLNLDDALCKTQYLAYLNHVDPESTWSPLDLAAFRGDTNAVSKLLKAGASATLQNKLGAPPLFHACCFSHYEVAKLLVEAGADVNEMVDDRGITPPFISAVNETGYETDRKVLSVVGNHVNHKLRKGATPLCFAAAQRSTKTVALLIDHGADVNHMDKDGDRPIMYAVVYRRHDNVRLLLKHGCDYRFTTAKGKNVLHYLAEFPDVEMFKVFKEARMRGFPTEQDRTQKIHVKTPLESFNQRDSTAELRRAFNELLESINKDDEEEEESEGSDEFCDAVEEL
ncbi:ankyrin repeat-containing domain protein [Cercophora samala]|uniref:Ankyrin repeat-containing domain protein n=1 Tax=Cercophora samala TaxID=330535 RepID=A0AA39ZA72_9PEZI|nr:ankyrin repeat-containing domain protein [Cercophora samala]